MSCFQLEEPEIMVRFALLPFVTYNDYEDLTNDEFLDRIREPIDSELIAVSFENFFFQLLFTPKKKTKTFRALITWNMGTLRHLAND